MEQTTDKLNLVYLLSNGRSGSTLLELLLNAHPAAWTVGELHVLPSEVEMKPRPCGCGLQYGRCGFWREVLEKTGPLTSRYDVDHFVPGGSGKAVRWPELPSMLFDTAPSAAIQAYADNNARLFRAILEVARTRSHKDVTHLVDASKSSYRLSWLLRSKRFNIKTIHIVKDPRAFIHSMTKSDQQTRWRQTPRYIGKWVFENALMEWITRRSGPDSWRTVTYEKLATSPTEVTRELFDWLGLEPLDVTGAFREAENHAVGGNPMRWESRGVALDTAWKQRLPAVYKVMTQCGTWPLRRLYGY